jgi:hypothetical protein
MVLDCIGRDIAEAQRLSEIFLQENLKCCRLFSNVDFLFSPFFRRKNGRQFHLTPEFLQPHKMIELSGAERRRISAHLAELYQAGLSLAEIAKQTGQPQTSVRTILVRAGIELRPAVSVPFARALKESGKRNVLPYFGFCYFQGNVVPDQREYGHLMTIYNLWKKAMNPNAIASLNATNRSGLSGRTFLT